MSEHTDNTFKLVLTERAQEFTEQHGNQYTTDKAALDKIAGRVGAISPLPDDVRVIADYQLVTFDYPSARNRTPKLEHPHDIMAASLLDEPGLTSSIADSLYRHPVLNPNIVADREYRTESYQYLSGGAALIVASQLIEALPQGIENFGALGGLALTLLGAGRLLIGREGSTSPTSIRPNVHDLPPPIHVHTRNHKPTP